MIGKVAVGVLLIILLFAFSGNIMDGIHDWRTDEITASYVDVDTTGVTVADVVLTRELFNDDTNEVISITSSIEETPVATDYTPGTKTLEISDLDTNTTRTLTVIYCSELLNDVFMHTLGPFLVFLIFGGVIAAVIYAVWHGRKH